MNFLLTFYSIDQLKFLVMGLDQQMTVQDVILGNGLSNSKFLKMKIR